MTAHVQDALWVSDAGKGGVRWQVLPALAGAVGSTFPHRRSRNPVRLHRDRERRRDGHDCTGGRNLLCAAGTFAAAVFDRVSGSHRRGCRVICAAGAPVAAGVAGFDRRSGRGGSGRGGHQDCESPN